MRSLGSIARVVALTAIAVATVVAPAGAAWTVAPGVVPSNPTATAGVVCVSSSACLVVGLQQGGSSSALAATWNGSSFAQQTPVSTTSMLYNADCGPTVCFAVGSDDGSGTVVPHAETWNGTSFGSSTTTAPSGSTYAILRGVGCPTSTACFAAGWYQDAVDTMPFMEFWNGTGWTLQSLSLPSGTLVAKLDGVACASGNASACWAVGYIEVTGAPRRTLVMHWDGTSWTTQTSANPAGAVLAQLHGIDCRTASDCEAVGEYIDSSLVQHTLAERWDGSSWSLQSVPDPSGATDPVLSDVSCASTSACEAVGQFTTSGTTQPHAAGWDGTSWTLHAVPRAHGTSDATLLGVSCPSTCMAAGYSIYDGTTAITGPRPLVELGP